MNRRVIAALAALSLGFLSCKKEGGGSFPGTEQGAKALLEQFLKPGADHAGLSKSLRPQAADYEAVFEGAVVPKLKSMYEPAWDKGALVIAPKEGQTELRLVSATSEELKSAAPRARELPGGYRRVAPVLKSGVTLYRFKFVRPGQALGMAYDGLVHVNGRWVIFPKPWRAM
jgi:hypothetical protein